MKRFLLFLTLLFISPSLFSQCESIAIDRGAWTILDVDTEETTGEGPNNGNAIHTIDGDLATFWHNRWQNFQASFPHFIEIDMGDTYPIDGIKITSRNDANKGKPKDYEVLLSSDGQDWGSIQAAGAFTYQNVNAPGEATSISFGAVNARYFRIVFYSNYHTSPHVAIAEIEATQISGGTDCVATGQENQILTFEAPNKHYADEAPFALQAESNVGLPVSFEIISGPASVEGNLLTLTGTAGMVQVRAYQEGTTDYYAAEQIYTFEVVDLTTIQPQVFTRLVEERPIEMPALYSYQLYAHAITEEADTLSITSISFSVDGEEITTVGSGAYYTAWWLPTEYGSHQISITATSSNNVSNTITRNVELVQDVQTQDVTTFEEAVIDFGSIGSQWYSNTYTLPQSVGAYQRIVAYLDVSCPDVPGACDDWDRLAWVQIKDPRGNWVELFRYITPYAVACDHSIDLSDYASLLQGEVEMRAYIETWGTGGWQLDLRLNYEQGTPDYLYSQVQEAWQGNFSFGDPANLQPVPVKEFTAPANTTRMDFRLVTTGHGWGQNNTANAAEFYYPIHSLLVDGEATFEQNMFTDCNPNPDGCTGQRGTWQYDRAGWCPGTIPDPYFYDMSNYIDNTFSFQYRFAENYMDNCHPNNPDCVSGFTCPDCNDGYNPYYRVGSYMIYKSNEPLGTSLFTSTATLNTQNDCSIYPNPSTGLFKVALQADMYPIVVQVYNVKGESLKHYRFENRADLEKYTFDLQGLPKAMYYLKIYNQKQMITQSVLLQ